LLEKRLAETRMSEHDRTRALTVMRDAEEVANAIFWMRDRIESLKGLFLKPGFKS
jgi:hypothetical protein